MKKLPNFLFKPTTKKSPWLWRSCSQPRTLSFRTPDDIFKTINSAFDDETDMSSDEDEQIEAVVRGLRPGERLFLKLEETNSIMAAAAEAAVAVGKYEVPFEESVVLAVESKEPYLDFKKSMEEMVEAHGLKDWKAMERLLAWYLKANGKSNHHFIIGAFVDLLFALAFASNHSNSNSNSNSNSYSSCSCCLCNNSLSSSSFSSSSRLCSSSSSDSSSSFGVNAAAPSSCCIIMEDMIECTTTSSSSIAPCLSSLFEDDEEEDEEEDLEQQHF